MSRSEGALAERISEGEVRACLLALYTRMQADRMVGFFFEGRDVGAIVEGQVRLVRALLGGAERYEGAPLPQAHAALPLLPGHFDRRHTLLREVLEERGVDEMVKAAWLEADAAWRKAILAAGEEARAEVRRTR
jgi:truncated hemoglobin YjbI